MGVPLYILSELSHNGGRFSEMKFSRVDKMYKYCIPGGKNLTSDVTREILLNRSLGYLWFIPSI